MANPRQRFERFCLRNRDKGISNLMMYISLGSALVYIISYAMNSQLLYYWLYFDYHSILRGQVWRLFTYVLTFQADGPIWTLLMLLCYFSLGRTLERTWGTVRFNLYYLATVVLTDLYAMIIGTVVPGISFSLWYYVNTAFLNMSLFLCFATLHSDAQFTLYFIIPIRAWLFALIEIVHVVYYVVVLPFPANIFPVLPLIVYLLFFGKEVVNVLPPSWRAKLQGRQQARPQHRGAAPNRGGTVPFPEGRREQSTPQAQRPPYTHRCTICGRTDVSHPQLEFRYCSRCKGYHCYCQEHISNHDHVTE